MDLKSNELFLLEIFDLKTLKPAIFAKKGSLRFSKLHDILM